MTAARQQAGRAPTSSRFPYSPFPTGWFQVAWSDELPAAAVRPLAFFGRPLVLWRTERGEARLAGAHCPHLGAHLGCGGRVVGERLRCPFHAWEFGTDGRCEAVPYATRVPPRAGIETWPIVERNGALYTFHGPAPADLETTWRIPEVPELASEEWTEPVRRFWRIRAHNQEMAENAVDRAHFRYVHGTVALPESTLEAAGPHLRVHSKVRLATPMGEVDGAIESSSLGFGFGTVRFTGIVETLAMTSVTPTDGEHVEVRFAFTVKKLGSRSATAGVGAALIADIEKQMAEDTPIWENKVHLERPVLCDGDGPIGEFRRWCRQFYPELATPAATGGGAIGEATTGADA